MRALRFLLAHLGWCVFLGGAWFTQEALPSSTESRERFYFDIPELPLHQAILEFAMQADCEVIAQEQDLIRQRGRKVRGYHSALQALQELLADADLTVEFLSPAQAYVIRAAGEQSASEVVYENRRIEEVIVTAQKYPARYQTVIGSEDRYGGAVFDITRAHNILPTAVLEDSSSDNLMETLRYVSSATPGDGLADSNDDYFIRGFSRQNTYINGLRLSNSTAMQIVPETVNRLDVLKGPSMLFYGQSSAGGVVDITRKQAADEDRVQIDLTSGEPTRQRFFIEANKAQILGNTDFLVMGMNDRQQVGADGPQRHRQLVAARARGSTQDRLIYNAGYEYQYLNKSTVLDFPVLSDSQKLLSYLGRDFINQAEDEFSSSAELFDGSFNFTLIPEWQLQGSFLWQREFHDGVRTGENFLTNSHVLLAPNSRRPRVGVATIMDKIAVPILQLGPHYTFGVLESVFDQHEAENAHTASLALDGRVQAGTVEHQIIAGVDTYHQILHQQYAVEERIFTHRQVFSEAVLLNPQQTLIDAILREAPATHAINLQRWQVTRDDWGSYLQVRSNWTADWSTSLGWRYSQFYETRRDIDGRNSDLKGNYDDWLLQAGSSWQLTDVFSLYANYSETLSLNYLIDDFDRFVEQPEKSHQHELGLKWHTSDGQMVGTLSLFDITSSGINTVKFESGYRTLQAPQNRVVRGIELDLTWRMNNRVEWIASGAVLHNKLGEQNAKTAYPSMVADNTLGIFGRISLTDTWASYAGINYVSDRSIDSTGDAKLAEYTLVDLTLEKNLESDLGQWQIRATMKNVLDEYHPSFAIPSVRVNASSGRHALIELSHEIHN